MRDHQRCVTALALALLAFANVADTSELGSRDFCVDTEVFQAGAAEPVASTKTLFIDNRIYDVMLLGVREAALIDLEKRRIELFDPARQVTTQIGFEEVIKIVAVFQAQASQRLGIPHFAAEPEFREVLDAATGNLSLQSKFIVYEAATKAPPRDDISSRYKQFADWSARLNSTRTGWPPAARLRLNQAIADRGRWPTSVRLVVKETGKVLRDLRSQHRLRVELADGDRSWAETIEGYRRDFRHISFPEYRQFEPGPLAKRDKPQNAK